MLLYPLIKSVTFSPEVRSSVSTHSTCVFFYDKNYLNFRIIQRLVV